MPELNTRPISCPYCAQTIEIVVDPSAGSQTYVEDCEVCCRPIVLTVTFGPDGEPGIDARREND